MTTIRPEDAEKAIESIVSNNNGVEPLVTPPDTSVRLPGGYVAYGSYVAVRDATVKELTGEDEEVISRTKSFSKTVNTILMRGVESIGNSPFSKELLEDLLSGDRDTLLVAIRVATFGPYLESFGVCPNCGGTKFETDLREVPQVELEDGSPRTWEVTIKSGLARLTYPTGTSHTRLMDAADEGKTPSELNTLLLSECLLSVDGMPSAGAATAKQLGMRDRETLLKSIVEKTPGPRLEGVTSTCLSCDEQVKTPLSIADLFQF
jgi:hypothetical protein